MQAPLPHLAESSLGLSLVQVLLRKIHHGFCKRKGHLSKCWEFFESVSKHMASDASSGRHVLGLPKSFSQKCRIKGSRVNLPVMG